MHLVRIYKDTYVWPPSPRSPHSLVQGFREQIMYMYILVLGGKLWRIVHVCGHIREVAAPEGYIKHDNTEFVL